MGATVRRVRLAWLLLLTLAGCKGGEVHRCSEGPAADSAATTQGEVLEDRTAVGKLQGPALTGPNRPQRVVFMLDYSGSMYGGFDTNRKSCAVVPPPGKRGARPAAPGSVRYYYELPEFRSLVTRLMDAATPEGGPTQADVVLFNGKTWRVMPQGAPQELAAAGGLTGDLPTGTGPGPFAARLASENVPTTPYKVDAVAPNSTETSTAVATVLDALPDEGIVWLLTDNIADQGATPQQMADAERNRAFYRMLAADPRIQVVAFYPLHLRKPDSWMCGSSLVAYGMYVSKHERAPSEEVMRLWGTDASGQGPLPGGLLWNPDLKALYEEFGGSTSELPDLSGAPMRLKPVDQNVINVGFVPLAEKDGQQRVLRCGRASFDDPVRCEAQIVLRNVLRHQRVDRAKLGVASLTLLPRLSARSEAVLPWASSVCAGEMKVSQWVIPETGENGTTPEITLGAIAPLQTRTVQVAFEVPPVTVGHDGLSQLWEIALTDAFELHGTLQANISDVATALHLDTSRFSDVYGIENIPQDFRSATTDRLRIEGPATARFTNDGQRLALLMLAGLVALVLAGLFFGFVMQRVYYTVRVDGLEHARIKLRRMGRYPIQVRNRTVAWAGRGLGGEARLAPGRGWRLRPDGQSAMIASRSDGQDPDDHRVELLRGWNVARNSPAASGNRSL